MEGSLDRQGRLSAAGFVDASGGVRGLLDWVQSKGGGEETWQGFRTLAGRVCVFILVIVRTYGSWSVSRWSSLVKLLSLLSASSFTLAD